jgi:hypothetical protein
VAAWVSEPNPTAEKRREREKQSSRDHGEQHSLTPRDLRAAGPIGMGNKKKKLGLFGYIMLKFNSHHINVAVNA